MGFLVASLPLGCNLMGWRGAGGGGAALVGVFYTFGGMLQIIGSVMEWIIGNTFPFVVFGSYGKSGRPLSHLPKLQWTDRWRSQVPSGSRLA